MPNKLKPDPCNCLALRQAARHVTQFYDHCLVPTGVRATQFSILATLERLGPMTINSLAENMVMDRTTLSRNIQPLEREGLVAVTKLRAERRSKKLQLTIAGAARLHAASKAWAKAQTRFEASFGKKRASDLRAVLRSVTASDLMLAAPDAPEPAA